MLKQLTSTEAIRLANSYAVDVVRWDVRNGDAPKIRQAISGFNFWRVVCLSQFGIKIGEPVGYQQQLEAIS